MRYIFLISVVLGIMLNGCSSCEKKKPEPEKPAAPLVFVPDFNADSAYAFVAQQVEFGPRVPGTPAHAACAEWMSYKLREYTPHVVVQDFRAKVYSGKVLAGKNIIASFQPESPTRILLCAHWDSRPYADHDPDPANHRKPIDGANDGGSGVGVLLEIARLLSQYPTKTGIDIILFDLEDYGEPHDSQTGDGDTWALGSQHWAKNPHKPAYTARFGILLDMVGAENATFLMEGTSMYYAPDVMRKVWRIAHNLGYQRYFRETKTGAITDDHLYINRYASIPTIDIIHYETEGRNGFFEHWHTVNDNLDAIDKTTLAVVGHVVLTVIYNEQ